MHRIPVVMYTPVSYTHLDVYKRQQQEVPYFFIGDDAFALTDTLMKPFSGMFPKGSLQRIFNYRICRA